MQQQTTGLGLSKALINQSGIVPGDKEEYRGAVTKIYNDESAIFAGCSMSSRSLEPNRLEV